MCRPAGMACRLTAAEVEAEQTVLLDQAGCIERWHQVSSWHQRLVTTQPVAHRKNGPWEQVDVIS
jgi:hypothetical protein